MRPVRNQPLGLAHTTLIAARELRRALLQRGLPEPAHWATTLHWLQRLAETGDDGPLVRALVAAATTQPAPLARTLTYDEASKVARCSSRTIRRRVAEGKIPVVDHRIPTDALLNYLAGRPA